MGTFFRLLGRHGFKMWGTYLLGYFIVWVVQSVAALFFYLFGIVSLLASVGIGASLDDPENLEKALETASPGLLIAFFLFVFLFYTVLFLIQSFHSAGSTGMATEAILDNSTSLNGYFRDGFRYFWKMFLQSILLGLLLLPTLVPLVAVDLGILFATEADSIAVYILWILWFLLLLAILFFISLLLYAPFIMIAENKGPWQSIRHSIRATWKSYGQTFITLLLLIASLIPFIVFYLLLALLLFLPFATQSDPGVGMLLAILLFAFIYLVSLPFMEVVIKLIIALRYKQNVRKWVVPESPDSTPENPYEQGYPPKEEEKTDHQDSYKDPELLYPQTPGMDPFLPPEETRQDFENLSPDSPKSSTSDDPK